MGLIAQILKFYSQLETWLKKSNTKDQKGNRRWNLGLELKFFRGEIE
jgi:hypothetical protein